MTQKLCDAADWFDPGFLHVVRDELREAPRFHRKQWEFVQILRALRDSGMLAPGRRGLTMGAGRERVLYAVAREVTHLTVTDLYQEQTTWACAETGDPEVYVKSDMPIPCDPERITVASMDMTSLRFPDGTFDFCYSSCAIEHIGGRPDFLRHLNEVARVLKPGGVYVFTTELAYQEETCTNPGNYLFSPGELSRLVADSDLAADGRFDAAVWPHQINWPRPASLSHMLGPGAGPLQDGLVDEHGHLQLLQGYIPFTSCLLRTTKRGGRSEIAFDGFAESCRFMAGGAATVQRMIEDSSLALHPFSGIEGRWSPCCIGHEAYRTGLRGEPAALHLLHTDYCWLGGRPRTAEVRAEIVAGPPCDVTVGVNRYHALTPWVVEPVFCETLRIDTPGRIAKTVAIDCNDRYCYACYATTPAASLRTSDVSVMVHPA